MGRPGSFDRDDEESLRLARLPVPLSMCRQRDVFKRTRSHIFYALRGITRPEKGSGLFQVSAHTKGVGAISNFCVERRFVTFRRDSWNLNKEGPPGNRVSFALRAGERAGQSGTI